MNGKTRLAALRALTVATMAYGISMADPAQQSSAFCWGCYSGTTGGLCVDAGSSLSGPAHFGDCTDGIPQGFSSCFTNGTPCC